MMTHAERIHALINSIPELHNWSETKPLFAEHWERIPTAWQLPAYVCAALGHDTETAMPAIAALGCMQKSIILVDDMLDEEADALYTRMGHGRAANFACGLQAAACALLDQSPVPAARRQLAQQTLVRLALQTAAGQEMDVQDVLNEEVYWQVVRTKSAPFYAEALRMGAQLAGAHATTADTFSRIGGIFGEIIQIHDDLEDAFAVPAKPDWARRQNNLLILYATTAEYAERSRFIELCDRAAEETHLREAQQLLLQSGAVSYAIYQAAQREQHAQTLLAQIAPSDPSPIVELFVRHRTPFVHFLEEVGVDSPGALFAMG